MCLVLIWSIESVACAQGSINLSLLVDSSISKACVDVNAAVFGVDKV